MDKHLYAIVRKRIDITLTALRKNRFEAHFVPTKAELPAKVSELIPAGASCSLGGSVTIAETGIQQMLENGGDFNYLDRYAQGVDREELMRKALTCDVYLTGTNAITMDGKLYNVDGRGNRVAAICWGPRRVVVICGHNKIVRDLEAARERNRQFAAPANVVRLGMKTPCAVTGICQDCACEERICCMEVVTGFQRINERICVLIVGEEYGY